MNSNRENPPPEIRDSFTRLIEQSDTLIESLSRGGGYVDKDLDLIAAVRDGAARVISLPPLTRPLVITTPAATPRATDLAHLRSKIDQLALCCAGALVSLRAMRDENAGAAWVELTAGFEDALARLVASKAN